MSRLALDNASRIATRSLKAPRLKARPHTLADIDANAGGFTVRGRLVTSESSAVSAVRPPPTKTLLECRLVDAPSGDAGPFVDTHALDPG